MGVAVGVVGAGRYHELPVGGVHVDAVGRGKCRGLALEYLCGLQCLCINGIEGCGGVIFCVIRNRVAVYRAVVVVENRHRCRQRRGAVLIQVVHQRLCRIGAIVAETANEDAVVVERRDALGVAAHGDAAGLAEAVDIDHAERAVVVEVAVLVGGVAAAHVDVVACYAQLLGVVAAKVAALRYGQRGCVDADDAVRGVAADVKLTVMCCDVARIAVAKVYLLDALARLGVDNFEGARFRHGHIEFASIMEHVACQVAQPTAVCRREERGIHGTCGEVYLAEFGVVAAPRPFVEHISHRVAPVVWLGSGFIDWVGVCAGVEGKDYCRCRHDSENTLLLHFC